MSKSRELTHAVVEPIHTVIVGHADFPRGILSAAERIVGKQEGITVVSNHGLGASELAGKIEAELGECVGGLYVFVDLVGGSCFNACRSLLPRCPKWVLISGVNLPMIVTYLSYRTRLAGDELLAKTLEAGRRGMAKF